MPAPGAVDADKFLFDRGTEALAEEELARTPASTSGGSSTPIPEPVSAQDAKLGIGDAYLGEGRVDSIILAANEFREFLTFFPLNARADYAQYQLAVAQIEADARSGARPDRHARRAARSSTRFLAELSDQRPTCRRSRSSSARRATGCRKRSSKSACSTTASRYYGGAIARFNALLKDDPAVHAPRRACISTSPRPTEVYETHGGDAGQLAKDALPYYDKLIEEFKQERVSASAPRSGVAEIKR